MANCVKCGKKFSFFEKKFEEKYCEDCYNIYLNEKKEQERIIKEKNEKIKIEKMDYFKDYFLFTNWFWIVLKIIDNLPFHYEDIFKKTVNNKFVIIEKLVEKIIEKLPKDFTIKDLKSITTNRNFSIIVESALNGYVDLKFNSKRWCDIQVENQQYSPNPNANILDDIEYNSIFLYPGFFNTIEINLETLVNNHIETIKNLNKIIEDIYKRANNPKYNYNECMKDANEYAFVQKYEILMMYFEFATYIVYTAYYNREVEKIINESELYVIYKKLVNEVHNKAYIIDKLYPMYMSIYKNELNLDFEGDEDSFITLIEIFEYRNSIDESKEFISIEENIFNLNVEEYAKMSDESDMISKVADKIIYNMVTYRKNILFDDVMNIVIYNNSVTKIINNIKKQQAINERNRILNGDTKQEKDFVEAIYDYSYIDNGYDFEQYIANLYNSLGYRLLEITSKSGDQGADVLVEKDNLKYAIQVKYYNTPVGNKAIQEVVAAKNYYKTDKAIVVTNNEYTQQAIELAKANDVILVGNKELNEMIEEAKKNK